MEAKIHRGNFESNLLFLDKTGLLNEPKRILEIGSGKGTLVKVLGERGHDVVGTEVNNEYIAFAKDENGVDLSLISEETTRLPFPDQSFDIVLSFDVFEHIPDSNGHLQEVFRILKPEGYYLLCTPNKITNIPFEILKERSFTKYKEYHCALHTYWKLKSRLLKNGFRSTFVEVPLVTPYFMKKIRTYLGGIGVLLVKALNPDRWPIFMKTNFYVVASKGERFTEPEGKF